MKVAHSGFCRAGHYNTPQTVHAHKQDQHGSRAGSLQRFSCLQKSSNWLAAVQGRLLFLLQCRADNPFPQPPLSYFMQKWLFYRTGRDRPVLKGRCQKMRFCSCSKQNSMSTDLEIILLKKIRLSLSELGKEPNITTGKQKTPCQILIFPSLEYSWLFLDC